MPEQHSFPGWREEEEEEVGEGPLQEVFQAPACTTLPMDQVRAREGEEIIM